MSPDKAYPLTMSNQAVKSDPDNSEEETEQSLEQQRKRRGLELPTEAASSFSSVSQQAAHSSLSGNVLSQPMAFPPGLWSAAATAQPQQLPVPLAVINDPARQALMRSIAYNPQLPPSYDGNVLAVNHGATGNHGQQAVGGWQTHGYQLFVPNVFNPHEQSHHFQSRLPFPDDTSQQQQWQHFPAIQSALQGSQQLPSISFMAPQDMADRGFGWIPVPGGVPASPAVTTTASGAAATACHTAGRVPVESPSNQGELGEAEGSDKPPGRQKIQLTTSLGPDAYFLAKQRRNYRHEPFPDKLYRMLEEAERESSDIVSFTPSGAAIEIHDSNAFL